MVVVIIDNEDHPVQSGPFRPRASISRIQGQRYVIQTDGVSASPSSAEPSMERLVFSGQAARSALRIDSRRRKDNGMS